MTTATAMVTKTRSGFSGFLRLFRSFAKNRAALVGLIIVVASLFLTFFPGAVATQNPSLPNYVQILDPPSNAHLFGTDQLGRDIFSRVIYGTRISIEAGIFSGLLMLSLGAALGISAGYFGGKIDKAVSAFTDSVLMIPIIPLILVIIALYGSSLQNVILVIGLIGWPQIARILRSETLSLRKRDYIDAAKTSGVSAPKIILTHIVPNEMPQILVNAALGISFGILAEAAIDFLGLGSVQISWGFILYTSLDYWLSGAWWLTFFPGFAIFLASLSFYLLSEGITDTIRAGAV
jgi:peptide/nickel transport system permease protein